MPRQTRKYSTAIELAERLNITERQNQERLYRLLNEASYYWNSSYQKWEQNTQAANPPSELIHVRVWAEHSKVEGIAYQVRLGLEDQGYYFAEQSSPCPCRPPKQLESRIYMVFK